MIMELEARSYPSPLYSKLKSNTTPIKQGRGWVGTPDGLGRGEPFFQFPVMLRLPFRHLLRCFETTTTGRKYFTRSGSYFAVGAVVKETSGNKMPVKTREFYEISG